MTERDDPGGAPVEPAPAELAPGAPEALPEAAGGEAPDALAPPPGHPRFPLYDSMRAIAALSVLVLHAGLLSGALADPTWGELLVHLDIGVAIFFLLSGFLLYRPFVASRVFGAPEVRVRDYARRRVLRIVPGYWVALTVLAVFPGLQAVFDSEGWVYYLFLQIYPAFEGPAGCRDGLECGIAPAWSLSYEVAFYAMLPLYALALSRLAGRRGRRRDLRIDAAALAALAALSCVVQYFRSDGEAMAWIGATPLGVFLWFALGMGLAVASVALHDRRREPAAIRLVRERSWVPWALAIGIYVLASLVVLEPVPFGLLGGAGGRGEQLAGFVAYGVVAALLLLPATFGDRERGLVPALLRGRVLSWLGLISYGIFLYHFPVLLGLRDGGVLDWVEGASFLTLLTCGAAISIAGGAASYALVERPFLRLKYRRSERPRSAPRLARQA